MELNDILSGFENLLNKFQDNQIEKTKDGFNKSLGINKDQYDSVRKLIDSYQDSEESISQYNKQIEQCDDRLKKFDESIKALTDNLNKAKKSEDKKKIQDEINKKNDARSRTEKKKQQLEESLDKESFVKSRIASKFKRVTNGKNISQGVAAARVQHNAARTLAKGKTGSIGKAFGGTKANPYLAAIALLVKAAEFGISKATDYMRLNYENLLRQLNATTAVSLNTMRANMAAWQDSVTGAYEAQNMAISSQEAMLEAQNATELANYKMVNTWTNWIPIWGQINKYQETALEMEQQMVQTRLKNAHEIISMVNQFTKKTDEYIKSQENAMRLFQIDRGLSSEQYATFQSWMLKQGEIFAKFNRTIEDVLKMQSSFTEKSGRAVNFSENDNIQTIAVGRLVGDENLVNFQAQMQLFNHSVAESADIMYEMYKDVNKMGLSQKKVTKDVLANLKLANKYDFKNGTKGFIELAKWAENARFNLSSLGSMIEKVQGGGLEGTITQAAKLQVLGGNFAMNADPLSMVYNAYADPESYAKQIQKMFKGIGRFNNETGETVFNIADNLRIRAAAEAIGMSTEDAKNMVREENKKNVVMRQMKGSTLTQRQKEAVANKAQRDERTGEWYVNMIGGGRESVSQVNEQNFNNIVSDNNDEAAVQYAKSTMSFVKNIEATTKEISSRLATLSFDDFKETVEESNKNTLDYYYQNINSVIKSIKIDREESIKAQEKQLKKLESIGKDIVKALAVVHDPYEELDIDKEQQKIDIRGAQNRYRRNIQGRGDASGEKFGKAVAVNALERGGDSGWNWWKNRFFALRDVGVTNEELDRRAQATGYIDANGKPVEIDEETAKPIQDGIVSVVKTDVNDKVVPVQNKSVAIPANKIVPIHDGITSIAKSDPKDSAIFAKSGGPFDTLFNGIFDKINKIYGLYSDSIGYKSISQNIEVQPIPITSDKVSNTQISIESDNIIPLLHQAYNQVSNVSSGKFDVNVHGEINLRANGQSIDILNELQNNPILVRAITDMISDSISKKINGGRPLYNGYQW